MQTPWQGLRQREWAQMVKSWTRLQTLKRVGVAVHGVRSVKHVDRHCVESLLCQMGSLNWVKLQSMFQSHVLAIVQHTILDHLGACIRLWIDCIICNSININTVWHLPCNWWRGSFNLLTCWTLDPSPPWLNWKIKMSLAYKRGSGEFWKCAPYAWQHITGSPLDLVLGICSCSHSFSNVIVKTLILPMFCFYHRWGGNRGWRQWQLHDIKRVQSWWKRCSRCGWVRLFWLTQLFCLHNGLYPGHSCHIAFAPLWTSCWRLQVFQITTTGECYRSNTAFWQGQ